MPVGLGSYRGNWRFIALGVLGSAIVFAVGLLVWSKPRPSLDDSQKMADSIAKQCSMGGLSSSQSTVNANLAKYLSGLSAGATVTTSDVGALIDKITPNDRGLEIYRAYTDCLKQQAAILLSQKGISLVAPQESDIEARQDKQTENAISVINPNTPKEKLVQIFGPPIASQKVESESGQLDVDLYQYKRSAYAADYYLKGRRIGLVLSTRETRGGLSMVFRQIRGITLFDAQTICDGFYGVGQHGVTRTNRCNQSHATNWIARVYYFPTDTTWELSIPPKASCTDKKTFTKEQCNTKGHLPALAVAMVSNPEYDESIDRELNDVADAFQDELDFGHTFVF